MKKSILFCLALAATAASLASPVRDDMAGRNTDYSTGIPNVAFVEYLESDGNQFIDIYPQSGTETSFRFQVGYLVYRNSSSKQNFIFCPSNVRGSTGPRMLDYQTTVAFSCDWNNVVKGSRTPQNIRYDVDVIFGDDDTITWQCNSESGIGARGFYTKKDLKVRTFGTGDEHYALIGRIYYFRLYIDGVLVRDLRPIRVGSVGYMYDTLTDDILGNGGTGDFIVGPDTQEF